ncbi:MULTISPECIES: retron system putative HNH endonuclease [unclassified Mesorhizobium]|uniref:retron system putative HNH endonuclease n=1 Tax=unclassified Mesorhizobium TaxID=325217 RepID=UPI003335C26E
MKYSSKQESPAQFLEWLALENDDWKPSWRNFSGNPRDATLAALLSEQHFVCCYCGRALNANLSDSHIEHFRPRKTYGPKSDNDLSLEYLNFVASCGSGNSLSPSLPKTCGEAKGSWFDEGSHIAPWDLECEQRFAYGVSGTVIPKFQNDAIAEVMISVLWLDNPALSGERASVLMDIERAIDSGELTANDVAQEIAFWTTPELGARPTFGHVAARYLQDEFGLT